eukprot:1143489-Pelagomonas_calceolata.AAC.1
MQANQDVLMFNQDILIGGRSKQRGQRFPNVQDSTSAARPLQAPRAAPLCKHFTNIIAFVQMLSLGPGVVPHPPVGQADL